MGWHLFSCFTYIFTTCAHSKGLQSLGCLFFPQSEDQSTGAWDCLSCWVAIDLRTNLNKSHLTNNHSPGGGFKYFSLLSFSTPTCGDDPIWIIVFRWVGTTSNLALEVKYLDVKESNLHGLQLEISDTDRMGVETDETMADTFPDAQCVVYLLGQHAMGRLWAKRSFWCKNSDDSHFCKIQARWKLIRFALF